MSSSPTSQLRASQNSGSTTPPPTKVRPDIIYAGMTGFGVDPDKPYYPFRAFGPNQAPLVGWDALTGFPA